MELIQLKYFKTVAELGKISDAAQELFITAPALSTSIARLEKELGVKLFDRSNNKITLNQQGQIFLRCVNQIFSNIHNTKLELRQSIIQERKHISLACVASTQWVDMISAFSEKFPNYTLQCTSINRVELASSGFSAQHSFLLATEDDIPLYLKEKLNSTELFEDHPMVIVHENHPLAKETSVDLKKLTKEKLFLPMQDFPLYDHLISLFEECQIPFSAGNAYSYASSKDLASKRLGISFTSQHTVYAPVPGLRFIPISNTHRSWISRLYWRKNQTLSPDEQLFKNFIESYYLGN